ncbi:MAG TPA: thaumatin family protein [Streptosporangiaceae bacterium]|nr:thaumatin family protein [Streptosporangiaceae bacterium]
MAFRKWTNRSGRALATTCLAAVTLLLAACSAVGGPSVAGPGGTTGGGMAAGPAPAVAAPLTARPAVTASVPAATPHPARTARPAAASTPAATSSRPAGSGPAAVVAPAGSRVVTFVNRVAKTIWVAASPDAAHPLAATGWVLPAGQSVSIVVPDHYNGRFWGRTGCVFSGGHGHCQAGDCNGRFQCTGYGSIPATLAEYNLNAWDGLDFYDVSMVDGSNLPMYINISKGGTPDKISPTGCVAAGCTTAVACPAALQVKVGGSPVACESACARFGTDQYCCRGAWASRTACDPAQWPVDYAAVFKKAEPYAYSYSDDDATSTYTCTGECDYRITFGLTPGG